MSSYEVLKNWLRKLAGRWDLPLPVKDVSDFLGVSVRIGDWESFLQETTPGSGGFAYSVGRSQPRDGLFVPGSQPLIFLADSKGSRPESLSVRQRFTWAHELAHFLLWRTLDDPSPGNYWLQEEACNWFAGELLVPTSCVSDVVGRPSMSWIGQVAPLSRKCGVSWDVAAGCMTAFSEGRVLFLRGNLGRGKHGWRIEVEKTSAVHYTGHHIGSGSFIDDFIFVERCVRWLERGPGDDRARKPLITKISKDIGQIPCKDCYVLIWAHPKGLQMMIRLKGLPNRFSSEDQ